MIIHVQDIIRDTGSRLDLDFEEQLEDIELRHETFSFVGPVRFQGSITNEGEVLHLSGILRAKYRTFCASCGESVEVGLKLPIEESFVGNSGQEAEKRTDDDEDELYTFKGYDIDTADVFKDNILLNIPIRTVCSADCKGLCPRCGTNLNKGTCNCRAEAINPMMEKLKDFWTENGKT